MIRGKIGEFIPKTFVKNKNSRIQEVPFPLPMIPRAGRKAFLSHLSLSFEFPLGFLSPSRSEKRIDLILGGGRGSKRVVRNLLSELVFLKRGYIYRLAGQGIRDEQAGHFPSPWLR